MTDESLALSREAGGGPLYGLIAQRLRAQIDDGTYGPGDKLHSESQLCADFRVSRPVVRQALAMLEDQGYLYRVHGRGTFVATKGLQSQLMAVAIGPERDTLKYRSRLHTRVLVNEEVPATAAIAREMRLGPGAPVVHLRRLRYLDGAPLAVLESYLPERLVSGLVYKDLTDESLYQHLETHYSRRITRLRRSIGVGALDADLAALLDMPAGAPYLKVSSLAFLGSGDIVETSVASYRGDKITITAELAAEADGTTPIRSTE